MTKRWRMPNAKPGELKIAYGKERHDSPDIFFCFGAGTSKRDTNMLMHFFYHAKLPENGRGLIDELTTRGFDVTTIKFSIQKLKEAK